jgi:hypothetical protein
MANGSSGRNFDPQASSLQRGHSPTSAPPSLNAFFAMSLRPSLFVKPLQGGKINLAERKRSLKAAISTDALSGATP